MYVLISVNIRTNIWQQPTWGILQVKCSHTETVQCIKALYPHQSEQQDVQFFKVFPSSVFSVSSKVQVSLQTLAHRCPLLVNQKFRHSLPATGSHSHHNLQVTLRYRLKYKVSPSEGCRNETCFWGCSSPLDMFFYPLLRVILIFFPQGNRWVQSDIKIQLDSSASSFPAHPHANSRIQLPKSDWHGNPGFPRWKWVGKAWRRKERCRYFLFSRHVGMQPTPVQNVLRLYMFKFIETALRQLKPGHLFL